MEENFNWMTELYKAGYRYIARLSSNKNEVYVTKASKLKNGEFRSNTNFDVFTLDKIELYPYPDNNIFDLNG